MKYQLTQTQVAILLCVGLVMLASILFPTFGAPHFRYTGSDPDHYVWNIGWPLATCIYDATTSPYFFVGPIAFLLAIGECFGFVAMYLMMLFWNNS